jgi:hypothetical protein
MAGRKETPGTDVTPVGEPVVGEVIAQPSRFGSEIWDAMTSLDVATATLEDQAGGVIEASEVLGDGFEVVPNDEKGRYVGVPMLLGEWQFRQGDNGEYVVIRALVQPTGQQVRRVVFTDGSTGIMRQLQDVTQRTGKTHGLIVRHGFRRSDYTYTDDKGVDKKATTFYLDTSA